MKIVLIEDENKKTNDELFYNIIDFDTGYHVGILFTVCDHIAYEIKPEFRGNGAATMALKLITNKLQRPVLEIFTNNIASKRVALKAGYTLVRTNFIIEEYEYLKTKTK